MPQLYPPIEPYRHDTLVVSARHTLYYEEAGCLTGKPVIFCMVALAVGLHHSIVSFSTRLNGALFYSISAGAGAALPMLSLLKTPHGI